MELLRQKLIVATLVVLGLAWLGCALWPPRPKLAWLGERRVRGVVVGQVKGAPRRSASGWTLEIALERIDRRRMPADRPRVRLFVPADVEHPPDRARGAPPALPGDRVEVFARLEHYPSKRFSRLRAPRTTMAGRGIDARATALEPLQVRPGPAGLERRLARWRARFEARLLDGPQLGDPPLGDQPLGDQPLDRQQAALAVALTTGNRAFLDPAIVAPFRQTGTSHLLAISGLHLGVLAALVWWAIGLVVGRLPWLLRRFGRRRVCGLAVIACLGCYVLAIGAPVSAVRAWVGLSVGVGALILLRPVCPFHALALAALVLVVWQPAVVLDLGFQLSFAATLAILLFLRCRPPILEPPEQLLGDPEPSWHRRLRRLGLFVGVSTSATLATWPIVAAHFGVVPAAGLWVNLVVTPLVSALLFPALVAGALLSLIVPPIGLWLVAISTEAILAMGAALAWVADLPGAQWVTGAVPGWASLALAVGALVAVTSRWQRARLLIACAAIGVGLSPAILKRDAVAEQQLRVHFIPVGQGAATLLELPDGQTMLVDGGGSRLGRDPGRFVVVPYLHRLGIARLDWVVATHADTDHIGGLFVAVRQMRPRHFVYDARESQANLGELARLARRRGARLHPITGAVERRLGAVGVRMIRPRADSGAQNDASIVTRLRYGPAAVLLSGDVERPAEQWLIAHEPVRATVLSAPHHGSKTSSSARFLDAVRPQVAVVSAGRFNRFGHPHPQVLARYRRRHIKVFQTAVDGLVRVDVDGDGGISVIPCLP